MTEEPRKLSRNESHDLSMIIKDRTKVLRAHAEEQAAACMADLRAAGWRRVYTFDQNEVWQKATMEAQRVVQESQKAIREALQRAGHPADLRAVDQRQLAGPRREHAVGSPHRAAARGAIVHRCDDEGGDSPRLKSRRSICARRLVGMGLLSADAKMFLESLARDRGIDARSRLRRDREEEAGKRAAAAPCGSAAALWRRLMVEAPWTDEQVENLNRWQHAGHVHEFTCPNDHPASRVLIARKDGWHCPAASTRRHGRSTACSKAHHLIRFVSSADDALCASSLWSCRPR